MLHYLFANHVVSTEEVVWVLIRRISDQRERSVSTALHRLISISFEEGRTRNRHFFFISLLYSSQKGDAGGAHKYVINGEVELYLQHKNIRLRQIFSYTVQ